MDAIADPMIRLDRVSKRYPDGTVAVEELTLAVPLGAVAVLVGPSGCGKTTTMRMVNRLVEPTSGRVEVGGEDVTTTDAVRLRRNIGYVIQQVGLFPHQTVADNISTVPRLLRWDKRRTAARVGELLDLVGLDPDVHARRYPAQLSGGQRQRVGVARALAADPAVLLMDEPFGAVDPIARDRLQAEFLRLQEQVGKTVVFVTHDVDEAIRLGDRIAVMREGGHLEQYDEPSVLLSAPATEFVAEFVGADTTLRRLSVTPVEEAAAIDWPTVRPDATLAEAAAVLDRAEADWVLVVGEREPPRWLSRAATGRSGTVGDNSSAAPVVARQGAVDVALAALLAQDGPGVLLEGDPRHRVLTAGALLAAVRRPSPR